MMNRMLIRGVIMNMNSNKTNIDSFEGIVVPPGCDHKILRDSGEPVHTYTPASYDAESYAKNQKRMHMMSGKCDLISVPQSPLPSARRSIADYLQKFQGAHLCLDLWTASRQKIKRCGILLEIGQDFLVMGDAGSGKISLIDLKPICYINIYCR